MTKKIIFNDSFLVSDVMCFSGCGATIAGNLAEYLEQCKINHRLPQNAQLIMDAEPQTFGIHRLFITVESDTDDFQVDAAFYNDLKASIDFPLIDNVADNLQKPDENYANLINIAVNLVAIIIIVALSILMTPSISLTVGLTTLVFVTTTFTTRDYILNFFRNLRSNNPVNMTTTITAGWFLSLAHTLYHSIIMPLASSFSMISMSFLMPVMLITIINSMDEIKRLVMNKIQKMHLKNMQTLFPEMAKQYNYQDLVPEEQLLFASLSEPRALGGESQGIPEINRPITIANKSTLKKGMLIHIPVDTCFPVDCILIDEQTLVDSSLLTGEPQQNKYQGESIPAGAINRGPLVRVYALNDPYNSTINRLLFRSNRKWNDQLSKTHTTFTNLYAALNALGLTASILIPYSVGILSIPLLLQNITGILFAVCPCTLAIAHQLPSILSLYQRSRKGIVIRDEHLCDRTEDMHTIVFDKTGTLTTGNSEVESMEGIEHGLFQRIYLLEKKAGGTHPLAKAVIKYYESTRPPANTLFTDVENIVVDAKGRGLSARVQGQLIHIGNLDYIQRVGITITGSNRLGFSAIYVAENEIYKGVIYIKHEIRKGMLDVLTRLKHANNKITMIMLTGDSTEAAIGFNQQNGAIFDVENIHAEQTPQDKETFIETIMKDKPEGVWFVGDGLNDAACARMVSEKGGVSCAITVDEKASFFTDISLNGSLNYLLAHNNLNQFLQKNTRQNQFILIYGTLSFIIFIITLSTLSLAVSPLIPLTIMASTTLMVLLNSYRMKLEVDNVLDEHKSWIKQFLASDLCLGLLMGSSLLLSCGLLLSTIATAAFALPLLILTANILTVASSALFVTFLLLASIYVFTSDPSDEIDTIPISSSTSDVPSKSEPRLLGSRALTFYSPASTLRSTPEFQSSESHASSIYAAKI